MDDTSASDDVERCDVLVVGAGPTGLALAAALRAFGVVPRLVDSAAGPVHESRALAVQPRTLEVLRSFGLADELVARGNPAVRLRLSAGGRVARIPLFDLGTEDTAFPFLLFVSQAETEAVLVAHLAGHGVQVERGTTLETLRPDGGGESHCSLRHADGARTVLRARYVVGCDGAGSRVREQAGIAFRGGRYPQTFLLADLAADGLEPGTVNSWLGPDGPLFFFPLGRPAPWRLITVRARSGPEHVTVGELQQATDRATGGSVRVGDPVWTSAFRVHHRVAASYRAGRVFLAGDAAHVHSPAGGQGMNTGIQDAVDLAARLAAAVHTDLPVLTSPAPSSPVLSSPASSSPASSSPAWALSAASSSAAPSSYGDEAGRRPVAASVLSLDGYEAQRRPIAVEVVAFTHRMTRLATLRRRPLVAARNALLPAVGRVPAIRRKLAMNLSELATDPARRGR
jgi:2-polyprenyl-6-methoxyphenol hydroxylase-like FAD-dependent oxidoreductase